MPSSSVPASKIFPAVTERKIGRFEISTPSTALFDEFAAEAGLIVGEIYSLDLFQAERHPSGSNFKITTSMTFVDCGINPIPR